MDVIGDLDRVPRPAQHRGGRVVFVVHANRDLGCVLRREKHVDLIGEDQAQHRSEDDVGNGRETIGKRSEHR
jgi:hypothetical protein